MHSLLEVHRVVHHIFRLGNLPVLDILRSRQVGRLALVASPQGRSCPSVALPLGHLGILLGCPGTIHVPLLDILRYDSLRPGACRAHLCTLHGHGNALVGCSCDGEAGGLAEVDLSSDRLNDEAVVGVLA